MYIIRIYINCIDGSNSVYYGPSQFDWSH